MMGGSMMSGSMVDAMVGAMWLWPTLLLLALVAVAVAATRLWPRRHGASAQRILDERFARGEIDGDEYRARRDQLG